MITTSNNNKTTPQVFCFSFFFPNQNAYTQIIEFVLFIAHASAVHRFGRTNVKKKLNAHPPLSLLSSRHISRSLRPTPLLFRPEMHSRRPPSRRPFRAALHHVRRCVYTYRPPQSMISNRNYMVRCVRLVSGERAMLGFMRFQCGKKRFGVWGYRNLLWSGNWVSLGADLGCRVDFRSRTRTV